jgi:UDP-glucose 4-epimerase
LNTIVTGGAGFIGSHLVEYLLARGSNVTVIDNLSTGNINNLSNVIDKIKFINCDLCEDQDLIDKLFKNIDCVFHLAALADIVPSIQRPDNYFRSNVLGSAVVAEAARKNKVHKIIYAASSSCYGIPKDYPTPEQSTIDLKYPYALTKRLGEELLLHWGLIYNIPVISLRLFNVYGPRARTGGTYGAVMGVFIAQKLANKPLTIVGNGKQTRDFTFVSDVVEAFYKAATSSIKNEVLNVGSGKTIEINYLAKLISENHIFIPKRPGEPDCTFADISKIQNMLGWQPKVSLEKGLNETLKNSDYWLDSPVWTPELISEATKDWFKFLTK